VKKRNHDQNAQHRRAALLAISSVAVLPACSTFGGDNASHTTRLAPQSPELSQDMVQQVQTRLQQQGHVPRRH
jgi:hypothetical protein